MILPPPRPVRDDADALQRMRSLARRLKEANCPLAQVPRELLDEDKLLRAYARKRVAQETARLDQSAAATMEAINATAAATNGTTPG